LDCEVVELFGGFLGLGGRALGALLRLCFRHGFVSFLWLGSFCADGFDGCWGCFDAGAFFESRECVGAVRWMLQTS